MQKYLYMLELFITPGASHHGVPVYVYMTI